MSLYYFGIANDKNIVCSHSYVDKSSCERNLKGYLSQTPIVQDLYFCQNGYYYYILTSSGLTFAAVTSKEVSRDHAHRFIVKVSEVLCGKNLDQNAKVAAENGLQNSFGITLQQLAKQFGGYKNPDRLDQLQQDVKGVTSTMQQNVQQTLQMQTKLEKLVDDSDQLQGSSQMFQKTTKKVVQKKKWENMKMKVIIAGLVGGVVIVVLIVILWQAGVFSKH